MTVYEDQSRCWWFYLEDEHVVCNHKKGNMASYTGSPRQFWTHICLSNTDPEEIPTINLLDALIVQRMHCKNWEDIVQKKLLICLGGWWQGTYKSITVGFKWFSDVHPCCQGFLLTFDYPPITEYLESRKFCESDLLFIEKYIQGKWPQWSLYKE